MPLHVPHIVLPAPVSTPVSTLASQSQSRSHTHKPCSMRKASPLTPGFSTTTTATTYTNTIRYTCVYTSFDSNFNVHPPKDSGVPAWYEVVKEAAVAWVCTRTWCWSYSS